MQIFREGIVNVLETSGKMGRKNGQAADLPVFRGYRREENEKAILLVFILSERY